MREGKSGVIPPPPETHTIVSAACPPITETPNNCVPFYTHQLECNTLIGGMSSEWRCLNLSDRTKQTQIPVMPPTPEKRSKRQRDFLVLIVTSRMIPK